MIYVSEKIFLFIFLFYLILFLSDLIYYYKVIETIKYYSYSNKIRILFYCFYNIFNNILALILILIKY